MRRRWRREEEFETELLNKHSIELHGIEKIDEKKGDYLILTDYGSDGMGITSQHKTLDEAVTSVERDGGSPQSIVKLVELRRHNT